MYDTDGYMRLFFPNSASAHPAASLDRASFMNGVLTNWESGTSYSCVSSASLPMGMESGT